MGCRGGGWGAQDYPPLRGCTSVLPVERKCAQALRLDLWAKVMTPLLCVSLNKLLNHFFDIKLPICKIGIAVLLIL